MASSTSRTQNYFCIDVECVAIDHTHSGRAVALISVVNYDEREVLRLKVKPDQKIVNYLTPLTGLKLGDLDEDSVSLDEAIEQVKREIGSDSILVGQRIIHDIEWLKLKEGVDFKSYIDVSLMFKTYNQRFKNYSYFSLRHEADMLLQRGFISDEHDPARDGIASIKLFKKYYNKPDLLAQAKQTLVRNRPAPSWQKRCGYQYQGICMAGYFPEKCICEAPTLKPKD